MAGTARIHAERVLGDTGMNVHQPADQGIPISDVNRDSERRRRARVKVSAQIRVRATDPKAEPFTELATSIDVSRDGILFSTGRRDFWKGMSLGVTFPFSSAPNALNAEEPAEVVRTLELPDNKLGVAIQFRRIHQRAAAATAATGPGAKEKSAIRGASSAEKGAPIHSARTRPIVLVVESDERSQEQLKSLLTPEGYDVYIVSTGKAALDILRTTVPACFIAEVEAGDTSGYDLCLIIKNSERLAHVPVVLVTRNAQPADYAASHNFGAVVCMAKPFKPERMLQVVRLVAPVVKPDAPAYSSSSNDASPLERHL
ncbi:MAG TPA: response regulator [Candidatus Acidoferrales bacterium]|nr:response regulator [Candidatus Acidoferrales bacterium]